MLIDLHAHVYDEPGYGEELAETAKDMGLDCLCIAGDESRYGVASNAEVHKQAQAYPDLFIPFAHVTLGEDGPSAVERLKGLGFRGICVWAPPAPYDDESFFPVYEAAQALQMPVLFHTGFVPRTPLDRARRVRCANMQPVHLDTVARCFPELKVVGVGLGNPWCEEAVEALRHNPNLHFDLSGDILRRKGPEYLGALLRPARGSPWEQGSGDLLGRIVFGSAVRHEEIASVERDYQRVFRSLALRPDDVDAVMGQTAARMLAIPTGP
jgi:hypothetical protein